MNKFFFVPFFLLTACVTKKAADERTREAYRAGQEQAAKQWQGQKLPQVAVHGPVRNSVIPWTEEMTVARAIVAADYTGFMNPVLVRVFRGGQMVSELKGIDLLHHQDFPLQAGDIVDIVP